MTSWTQRSHEERTLLNPGFCAHLLWHAAFRNTNDSERPLSFEESFLVLPFVLHRDTREGLPRDTRTSLAVWLDTNPLARGRVATRARLLVPFTKEALLFGGVHGFISLDAGQLRATSTWQRPVSGALRDSSDEVRLCAKRANFVGKWFAKTGNAATVLALMGVRP